MGRSGGGDSAGGISGGGGGGNCQFYIKWHLQGVKNILVTKACLVMVINLFDGHCSATTINCDLIVYKALRE